MTAQAWEFAFALLAFGAFGIGIGAIWSPRFRYQWPREEPTLVAVPAGPSLQTVGMSVEDTPTVPFTTTASHLPGTKPPTPETKAKGYEQL